MRSLDLIFCVWEYAAGKNYWAEADTFFFPSGEILISQGWSFQCFVWVFVWLYDCTLGVREETVFSLKILENCHFWFLSHKTAGPHCALSIARSLKARAHRNHILNKTCKKDHQGKVQAKRRELISTDLARFAFLERCFWPRANLDKSVRRETL